jgi:hypothetical protein
VKLARDWPQIFADGRRYSGVMKSLEDLSSESLRCFRVFPLKASRFPSFSQWNAAQRSSEFFFIFPFRSISVYPRASAARSISFGPPVGTARLRLELNLPVVGGFVLCFAALQFSGTILRFLITPSGHSSPLSL